MEHVCHVACRERTVVEAAAARSGRTAAYREAFLWAPPAVGGPRGAGKPCCRARAVACATNTSGRSGDGCATGEPGACVELSGRAAGERTAEMTGCDPSAVVSRLDRLRNVRATDVEKCGRFGGGLVPLADRAVLVDSVLFVPDGLGDRGAGEQHRQGDDPDAPAGASSCEPRVHGASLEHRSRNLAETCLRRQARARTRNVRGRRRARSAAIRLGVPMM